MSEKSQKLEEEFINTPSSLLRFVDEVPSMARYIQAARILEKADKSQFTSLRVAILSSFTIEPLKPYLQVESFRWGIALEVYLGGYNLIKQEILNPQGSLYRFNPNIVIIAARLEEWCPRLMEDFLSLTEGEIEALSLQVLSDFHGLIDTFRKRSTARLLLHNFALPLYPPLGVLESTMANGQTQIILEINSSLAELAKEVEGVYILDYDRLCRSAGRRDWQDDKMWYMGKIPISPRNLKLLARMQVTFIKAILGVSKKCLVLDLDNTLWGGILGEEGLQGIQIGYSYPGNIYRDFQKAILNLYNRGVILAINSKNNWNEVEQVFQEHPDMVLRLEHFACIKVNWENKAKNMQAIAPDLNIGLDSMVFFDDDPVERELMQKMLPEVFTIEAPANPLDYCESLLGLGLFDALSYSEEDRERGKIYQAQLKRKSLEESASSLEDFYRALEMAAQIRELDDFSLPRVVQLIQRTNQFNLTTRRYNEAEISNLAKGKNSRVFYLRLEDKFGDNGIVGVAILKNSERISVIDTFLLSCRVIGRTVETAFLSYLIDIARESGSDEIQGEHVPTPKNKPVADFYAKHGFKLVSQFGEGSRWGLRLSEINFSWPEWMRKVGNGGEIKASSL